MLVAPGATMVVAPGATRFAAPNNHCLTGLTFTNLLPGGREGAQRGARGKRNYED